MGTKTVSITLPKPMPHQMEVLDSPARMKVIVCGRRWGKTATGLMATVAGHGPGRILRGAIDGGTIWWVAPSHKIAAPIWRDLKRSFGRGVDKSEIDKRIGLPGGGSVTVKSADNPDSLVAEGLDGVVCDEAADLPESAWKESIRPALTDKQGWALLIGTPDGMNWLYDLFQEAGRREGWARWQRPSSDNPLVPPEELEQARLDMGDHLFAQEHLAQFTSMRGAEFPAAMFGDHVWFDRWPNCAERVVAIDPSKGKTDKSDYSAIVRLGLGEDGLIYCEADIRRLDVSSLCRAAVDHFEDFRPGALGIEANGFQECLAGDMEQLARERRMMIPIQLIYNKENKAVRIRRTLTPYLSRNRLRFRHGHAGTALLLNQLRGFPAADYDDGPDALEMGVRLLQCFLAGGVGVDFENEEERVYA